MQLSRQCEPGTVTNLSPGSAECNPVPAVVVGGASAAGFAEVGAGGGGARGVAAQVEFESKGLTRGNHFVRALVLKPGAFQLWVNLVNWIQPVPPRLGREIARVGSLCFRGCRTPIGQSLPCAGTYCLCRL